MLRRILVALAVVIPLTAPPAVGQVAPAQKPSEVAAAIESGVALWLSGMAGGLRLMDAVRAQASQIGDRIEVNLAPITLGGPDGTRVEIGSIRIDLKPAQDGLWPFAAKFLYATPITVTKEGALVAEFGLASNRFEGIWSANHQVMMSGRGEIWGIAVRSVAGHSGIPALRIGKIGFDTRYDRADGGLWTGKGRLILDGLDVGNPGGERLLGIEAIELNSTIDRIDLDRYGRIAGDIKEMAAKIAEAPNAEAGQRLAAEQFRLIRGLFAGFSSEMRLREVTILNPHDGGRIRLKEAVLGTGVSDLDAQGAARLHYSHQGFSMDPAAFDPAYAPERVALTLTVAKLPGSALMDALLERLELPEDDEAADAILGEAFTAALMDARSELRLEGAKIETPTLGGEAAGVVGLDPAAMMQATGRLGVTVRGLDTLVASLKPDPKKAPADKGNGAPSTGADASATLALFQALGHPDKDGQGRPIRRYDFELTPEGQLMLNGSDVTPLLQGVMRE